MSQAAAMMAAAVADADEDGAARAAGEVGRLVDCSQADDRRMIRLVRARRLLYARNNLPVASYYSQVKALWQEVADEMGWTVADVRRKWSHVRNSYSRHLRNELHGTRTGRGRMVSRWYLADELDFLREHMATDTRASPYSCYAPSFLEVEKTEAEEKPLASPWLLLGKAERADDDSSSSAFGADETSSYFQFFRGLHAEYQELPARLQRRFKRDCLALLHALLDADQQAALNLSHSHAHSIFDAERDDKVCIVNNEYILSND